MAFHLHRNGTSTVFELAELRDMARRGDLPQDEYVYVDEKGEWLSASAVPELTGAWNIEENEATVAVQLTPELLASMAGLDVPPAAASAPMPTPRPVSAVHASAPTASGLTRAPDRPGAIAAKAAQAQVDDAVPTTFMQLPDELKQAAPAKPSVRVALQHPPAEDSEEEATAFMAALPADLPLQVKAPAATPGRAAASYVATSAATSKSRAPLFVGIGVAVLTVIGALLWWFSSSP